MNACGGNTIPVATPLPPPKTITPAITLTSTITPTGTISPTPTATSVPTLAWTGPTVTPGGPFPIGVYEAVRPLDTDKLEFFADGTYTANLAVAKFLAKGIYAVDGNEIVFNEEKGMCSGHPGGYPGRYIWSFDGKMLVFTVVEDPCPVPRKYDLQRQWIKQPSSGH
ncbi:MAG TPA: hypothetical protein VFR47_17570 [Anaerolineales bacterium]|nr:hypothetical protein [Anaerolineales bacterium]